MIQTGVVSATLTGIISGPGAFNQNGTGLTIIGAAETYTGPTNVNNGNLEISGSLASPTVNIGTMGALTGLGSVHNVTVTGNGLVEIGNILGTLNANGGIWAGTGGTVHGLVTVSAGSFFLDSPLTALAGVNVTGSSTMVGSATLTGSLTYTSSSSETFSGIIAGAASTVTMNHAGSTLTLNALNTYGGATTVTAGTLQIGTGTAGTLTGTSGITVNGTGVLVLELASGTVFDRNIVLGAATATVNTTQTGATAFTLTGIISGPGTLNQNGTGFTIINAAETYTGPTNVNNGVLEVTGSLASPTVNIGTLGELSGIGSVHNVTVTGNGDVQIANILGTLNATGGLWIGPGGTVHGLVTSSSGVFKIVSPLTALSGMNVTGGTISGTGTITGSLNYTSSSSETFSGIIAGAASTVTMNHAGSTLTLNALSTYGGATTVTAGTLQIGDGTTGFINTSSVSIASGGTFTLDLPINTLFNVPVTNAGHFVATGGAGNGYDVTGVISGAGNFVKNGSNRVILAANTYTGGTVINGGTLDAENVTGSATGSGPVTINSGGTLSGSGKVSGAVTLNSGGFLQAGNTGTNTLLEAGSLKWNGGSTLDIQVGVSPNSLKLDGALTKGTAGMFTLDLTGTVSTTAKNEVLITFTSTTFSLSDFQLILPVNVTGTLAFNAAKTDLEIDNLKDPPPGPAESPRAESVRVEAAVQEVASESLATPSDVTSIDTGASSATTNLIATPEPRSAVLTLLGLAPLLGWRRRRRGLKG
jgi:autotransporter-associated beta strand protein